MCEHEWDGNMETMNRRRKTSNGSDILKDKTNQGKCQKNFFPNFLGKYDAMAMEKFFWWWGRVGDVVIPSKLDRRGDRFGFVTMEGLTNANLLEK